MPCSAQVRSLGGHSARVGCLSWTSCILSSGSMDSTIINHDVRVRDHITAHIAAHEKEVCGLSWSTAGRCLASGGNDNTVRLWDAATLSSASSHPPQPLHALREHNAAVKALAWCPFQSNLLATGAGSTDRCIRFWNIHTGACINSIQTHAQVSQPWQVRC